MTANEARQTEAPAPPDTFPEAWWNVLHTLHRTPAGFQATRPTRTAPRAAADTVSQMQCPAYLTEFR